MTSALVNAVNDISVQGPALTRTDCGTLAAWATVSYFPCAMIQFVKSSRFLIALFLVLFAASQPPIVHGIIAHVDTWVLGVPFLYAYLLVVYTAQIAVLISAAWRA